MTRVFLVSNMYPSEKDPAKGIFVKKFEDSIVKESNGLISFPIKSILNKSQKSKASKIINYFIFYFSIFFNALFKKYDLIYVHFVSHSALPFLFLKLFLKKPIYLNFHGSDLLGNNIIVNKFFWIIPKLCKMADKIIVPSEYFSKIVIEKTEISRAKIVIYPSAGINISLFKPINKMECKKKLRIPQKQFVFGIVSRIIESKGLFLLLKVLKKIKEENNIDFICIVAGDGKGMSEFKELISKLNLSSNVIILGALSREQLVNVYNSMDLFLFPTLMQESLGLVALEAMACGVPVIGSKIGALPEFIKNGYNGYLFDVGNENDFTKKIVKFCSISKSEREVLSQKSINCSMSYCSENVTKELLEELKLK